MIRKQLKTLKCQLLVFWILPACLSIAFAFDWIETGLFTTDESAGYLWGTITLFATFICVPLSLKSFSMVLHRHLQKQTVDDALRGYVLWSGIRLGLLEVVVLLGLFVYFQTFDNLGGLCALIGLTTSFFCIPGNKKMLYELPNLSEEE